jgi:hypothetical protein
MTLLHEDLVKVLVVRCVAWLERHRLEELRGQAIEFALDA